jgi:aflatoxin B1 aldehyde reductase
MANHKSALPVVFGNMIFGKEKSEGIRVTDLGVMESIIETFQRHGHNEIDTARTYANGTSEATLADLEWQSKGLIVATKLYPSARTGLAIKPTYTHSPEDIRRGMQASLEALNTDSVDLWYLHGPDRETPFEDTLRAVNELYKKGSFKRLGISNYMSWEVAQIAEICIRNDWVRPRVYQAPYNAVNRGLEAELISCLRHYGIALYAFQPLAGGFLAGRVRRNMPEDDYEPGSRFDPRTWTGKASQKRYFNSLSFDALEIIQAAAEKHDLTIRECALRWMSHHSVLSAEKMDRILIGASSSKQLEESLIDLEKGALPEEVVQAMDSAWARLSGAAPKYHH